MKRYMGFLALLAVALLVGCEALIDPSNAAGTDLAPTSRRVGAAGGAAPADAQDGLGGTQVLNLVALLDGGQEVPPVESDATGVATFQYRRGSGEISFRLIVANIENVTMAHIHFAPRGANGPVVAWLYPDAAPPQLIPGRSQGILAEGVITADSLVGPLLGQELDALIDLMLAGNTYVNVHTSQFPPGEIRGQIDRGNTAAFR